MTDLRGGVTNEKNNPICLFPCTKGIKKNQRVKLTERGKGGRGEGKGKKNLMTNENYF